MPKRIFCLFVAFAVISCSCYPADVEPVLALVSDNRAELEQEIAAS